MLITCPVLLIGIGQASRALSAILDAFPSRYLQAPGGVHLLSFFPLPVLGHDRPSSIDWVIKMGLQRVEICA